MKSVPFNAYPRTLSRRGGVKTLRDKGRVPAIIYGRKAQPQKLEVVTRDLVNLIKHSASENLLLDLSVPEDPRPNRLVLLQEVQHHPLSGKILHVDLREVSPDEKVAVTVPLETLGEPVGVKTGGGVLEHVVFKVKVRALPKDLPEFLQIDVSKLELGQALHLGDIPAPPMVEVIGDRSIPVVAVAIPRAEIVETTEAATELSPETVEVIKEKKEEGEAGAEGAPAKAEKGEKGEKPEKGEKGEKAERAERPERPEKAEKKPKK